MVRGASTELIFLIRKGPEERSRPVLFTPTVKDAAPFSAIVPDTDESVPFTWLRVTFGSPYENP
jgi:hypothetical protein